MTEPTIDFDALSEAYNQVGKELSFSMIGLVSQGIEGTTAVLAAICSVIHYIEVELGFPVRKEIDKLIDDAVERMKATKH